MAYRFDGSGGRVEFALGPFLGYTFGPCTMAFFYKRADTFGNRVLGGLTTSADQERFFFSYSTGSTLRLNSDSGNLIADSSQSPGNTSIWYLSVVTWAGGAATPRFHVGDGTSWVHANAASGSAANTAIVSGDKLKVATRNPLSNTAAMDMVCAGIKKADTATDLGVEALNWLTFGSWTGFGFDWLIRFDNIATRTNVASPGSGDEISRVDSSLVADPPGWSWSTAPAFVPQIIWLTPAPLTGAPAAPTFESSTAYASVANRPAVTGTTRPFASSAALTGALNAASPGDLVQYTGAGILDIAGNYAGFSGRRYTGYVNIDLGLPGSANHVRFTGGGGAGLPAVAIYNSTYLRIYGGEITNPAPKTVGYDGLHIYGAQNPGNGSTNHIVWWNLLVHDTVDSGIKMLPNVVSGGGNAADNTIADCDIEAEVYRIGLDKSVDTSHAERGTGQHCCLLADTDPAGATYPSFLRNRVAIDGHDTGLTSSQGGGSVIELGFNDSLSTISGCTLILRGLNTMFNAQQQTGGNGLNLWGDAQAGVAIPFLQHSNATGSAVCNPGGQNRPGVVVAYGRHANTNQNAYEGTNPWQIGPTYTNVA